MEQCGLGGSFISNVGVGESILRPWGMFGTDGVKPAAQGSPSAQ